MMFEALMHLAEVFLPFDLESLSISTVNLLVAPSLDPQLSENGVSWSQQAHSIFDEMTGDGNQVAVYRKAELQRISDMLATIHEGHQRSDINPMATCRSDDSSIEPSLLPTIPLAPIIPGAAPHIPISESGMLYENGVGNPLTSAQIMDMANSIDTGDTEWMSQAIVEHSIW